jgi:hypothetical protein
MKVKEWKIYFLCNFSTYSAPKKCHKIESYFIIRPKQKLISA